MSRLTLGRSLWQSSVSLVAFALVTAGLVAMTHELTRARIADNRTQAAMRVMIDLLPAQAQYVIDLQFSLSLPETSALGQSSAFDVYLAHDAARQPQALFIPVTAPDGYSGAIHLLIALQLDGELLGVRVIEHQETPGLGDKIEVKKSPWIFSFDGRSLANTPLWAVQRDGGDFDQFTGATITPRAVIRAVERTLHWYQSEQDALHAALQDWVQITLEAP